MIPKEMYSFSEESPTLGDLLDLINMYILII